jgi:hypothetical protein
LEYILRHTSRSYSPDLYAVRTPPACFERYELQHARDVRTVVANLSDK